MKIAAEGGTETPPSGGGGKIAAVWRRREPVFTGGNKRGQDTVWFPVPS